MIRVASTLIACAAVGLAAGCGSSTSSTGASPSTAAAAASGGFKADTKPKFASPSPSAPIASGLVAVAYRSIAIHPDTLRVKVGSTIRWRNSDPIEHNVTSEAGPQRFASKNFGAGGTFEVTVTRPGVINYECTIHPASMNGSIEVVR